MDPDSQVKGEVVVPVVVVVVLAGKDVVAEPVVVVVVVTDKVVVAGPCDPVTSPRYWRPPPLPHTSTIRNWTY